MVEWSVELQLQIRGHVDRNTMSSTSSMRTLFILLCAVASNALISTAPRVMAFRPAVSMAAHPESSAGHRVSRRSFASSAAAAAAAAVAAAATAEPVLATVAAAGTLIATNSGDFGGMTLPIVSLALLAATIGILAGPVEE